MRNPDWNDDESVNYERLVKTCKDPSAEGLAYTTVMEMYHARKAEERHEEEKRRIREAIGMIAEGIHELERILGISIEKMAAQSFQKRMDELRDAEGGAE